ncbi:MAG: hypothetical protein UV42_C0073G0001, partial [Candidatus Magasanikbacteria bacterium GW2011_GWE2_42_7]
GLSLLQSEVNVLAGSLLRNLSQDDIQNKGIDKLQGTLKKFKSIYSKK